uniref:Uncharacterized protein n=1 Tax=Moniliophthora roreri TaxID=221103 RepID=A0A0W0FUA0_MONRR
MVKLTEGGFSEREHEGVWHT